MIVNQDFNSSKVRYKREVAETDYGIEVVFQFLQGTVQTLKPLIKAGKIKEYFNSSKVRYKP